MPPKSFIFPWFCRKFAHRGQIFCRNAEDSVPYKMDCKQPDKSQFAFSKNKRRSSFPLLLLWLFVYQALPSSLFYKLFTAFGTGNGDLALSLGHPHLLAALGTIEIAMIPVLDPLQQA